jgi:kynurenine formamidase
MAEFVDLSHTVEDGMVTYPGLPSPVICDFLSREESKGRYADGVEFQIGKLELVSNTGTYLDAPFHRYADGKDLSELSLETLADLDGVLIHVPWKSSREINEINATHFAGLDLSGKAVLICTGWDEHWGTSRYLSDNPYLTRDAAQLLADSKAKLVGIDSLNIDDILDPARPVHSILLASEIPIVEHLCGLEVLAGRPFKFFALPVKVKGMGTFPVRAFAIVE